jgi:hypothetical protein
MQRWGMLYEDMNIDNRWQIAFNFVYMARRVLFLALAFYVQDYPIW